MERLTTCQICREIAKYTCKKCGNNVCERHYKNGVCSACSGGKIR